MNTDIDLTESKASPQVDKEFYTLVWPAYAYLMVKIVLEIRNRMTVFLQLLKLLLLKLKCIFKYKKSYKYIIWRIVMRVILKNYNKLFSGVGSCIFKLYN